MAAVLGMDARVLVPDGIAEARIDAIAGGGRARWRCSTAPTTRPIEHAAGLADDRHIVVSDTSWPGYEEVPRRVIDGYATAFEELDRQLAGRRVDLALVPIGVGAYAAAVANYLRGPAASEARLVGVEPADAACLMASALAGRPVTVEGPHRVVDGGAELRHTVTDRLAGAERRLRRVLLHHRRRRRVGDAPARGAGHRERRMRRRHGGRRAPAARGAGTRTTARGWASARGPRC